MNKSTRSKPSGQGNVFAWQRPTNAELASIGRKLKRRIGRVFKAKGLV